MPAKSICRAFVIAVLAAVAAPVAADETGLAASHDWRREGGRTCFVDHYHYGSGSGASRKAATNDAVGSWSSFTDLEYGSNWARFSRAASKSIKCAPSSSGWDCNIEARPCR